MVFYMDSDHPMYVLLTRHVHLGSFQSLRFYLKLTKEQLFKFPQIDVAIIVVRIVASPQ